MRRTLLAARSVMWVMVVTVVVMFAVPRAALACPVCFGQSDSPMAQGVNMGMYFLLAVIGGVLVAFASFFIYLARRGRALGEEMRNVEGRM